MKTILVPTDFSPPAENAMLYAGALAQSLGAGIQLLNVYQIPVSLNDMPVLSLTAEELRDSAEKTMERNRLILQQQFPGLSIATRTSLGDIVDEIRETAAESKPFLVCIGKHVSTGVERALFGSTSLSIIRHLSLPVLVVPDDVKNRKVQRMALALDETGVGPFEEAIREVAESLQAELHRIHVQTGSNPVPEGQNWEVIRDDEFVHGIQEYVRSKGIDLLAILPHKHSVLERFFFKTHTAELMQKLSIPLLCIHH